MTNKENKLSQGTRVWLRDESGERIFGQIRSVNESEKRCSVSVDDGRILRGVHTARIFVEKSSNVFDVDGLRELNEGVFSDGVKKVKEFFSKISSKLKRMVSGKVFFPSSADENKIVESISADMIRIDAKDGDIPGGLKGFCIEDMVSGNKVGDPKTLDDDMTPDEARAYMRYYETKARGLDEGNDPEKVNIMAEHVLIDARYEAGIINESQREAAIKNIYGFREAMKKLKQKRLNEAYSLATRETENLDIPNVKGREGLEYYLIPYFESYIRRGNEDIDKDPLWDYEAYLKDKKGEYVKDKEGNKTIVKKRLPTDPLKVDNVGGSLNGGHQMIPMIWGYHGIGKTHIVNSIRGVIEKWIQSRPDLFKEVMIDGVRKKRTYDMVTINLSKETKESLSVLTIQDIPDKVMTDNGYEEVPGKTVQQPISVPTAKFPVFRFMGNGITEADKLRGNLNCNRGPEGTGCGGIIFFDELTRADKPVLDVCMTFFQDRVLDSIYMLGTQWAMVAAGNRVVDGVKIDWSSATYDRFMHMNFFPDVDELIAYIYAMHEKANEDRVEPEPMDASIEACLEAAKAGDVTALWAIVGDEKEAQNDAKERHATNAVAKDPSKAGKLRGATGRNLTQLGVWQTIMSKSDMYKDITGRDPYVVISQADLKKGILTDEQFDEYLVDLHQLTNTLRGYDEAEKTVARLRQYRQFSKAKFAECLNNTKLIEFFQSSIYKLDKKLSGKSEYTEEDKKAVTLFKDGSFVKINEEDFRYVHSKFVDIESETKDFIDEDRTVFVLTPLGQYLTKPLVSGIEKGDKTVSFSSIFKMKDGDASFTTDALGINTSNAKSAAYAALTAILETNGIQFKLSNYDLTDADPLKSRLDAKANQASLRGLNMYTKILKGNKKVKDIDDIITPLQWFNIACLACGLGRQVSANFISSIVDGICLVAADMGITSVGDITYGGNVAGLIDSRFVTEALFCVTIPQNSQYKELMKRVEQAGRTGGNYKQYEGNDRDEFGVQNGYLAGAIVMDAILGDLLAPEDKADFLSKIIDGDTLKMVGDELVDAKIAVDQ